MPSSSLPPRRVVNWTSDSGGELPLAEHRGRPVGQDEPVVPVVGGGVGAQELVAGVVDLADLVAVESALLRAVDAEHCAGGIQLGMLFARRLDAGGRTVRCAHGEW